MKPQTELTRFVLLGTCGLCGESVFAHDLDMGAVDRPGDFDPEERILLCIPCGREDRDMRERQRRERETR